MWCYQVRDGCQRGVGLESFGQMLRPFVANLLLFKLMVVNVVLDLSPSAKYFAPSSPILLFSKDGCQRGVGLESFGQILRPFVANLIIPN